MQGLVKHPARRRAGGGVGCHALVGGGEGKVGPGPALPDFQVW